MRKNYENTRKVKIITTTKNIHKTTYATNLDATKALVRRIFHARNFLKSNNKTPAPANKLILLDYTI